MGGGVLWQYVLAYPDDLASHDDDRSAVAVRVRRDQGAPTASPATTTSPRPGGGGAAPEFVRRLAAGDRSEDDPATQPARDHARVLRPARQHRRTSTRSSCSTRCCGPRVGDDFYPGRRDDRRANWPALAPGARGVLNAMSPKYYQRRGRRRPAAQAADHLAARRAGPGGQRHVAVRPGLPRPARRRPGVARRRRAAAAADGRADPRGPRRLPGGAAASPRRSL